MKTPWKQYWINGIVFVNEEILESILTQQMTEVYMNRLWGIQVLCSTIEWWCWYWYSELTIRIKQSYKFARDFKTNPIQYSRWSCHHISCYWHLIIPISYSKFYEGIRCIRKLVLQHNQMVSENWNRHSTHPQNLRNFSISFCYF